MTTKKSPKPLSEDQQKEFKHLKKQNARLKKENDLIKKVARVSSETKAERFEFIKNHGSELGVRYLCSWLEVSYQGFLQMAKSTRI